MVFNPKLVLALLAVSNAKLPKSLKEDTRVSATKSRILQNGGVLCPTSVGSQTFGYSQVSPNNKYLYAVIEADESPSTAPTFVHLAGGPGVSGMDPLLEWNGPCLIQQDGKTLAANAYSWTRKANGIWIDAPGPTGFSLGPIETTLTEYINNLLNLLTGVFHKYPHLNHNVHLAGFSADGSTAALLASKIITLKSLIDLKGIMIASAVVGPSYVYQGCLQMAKDRKLVSQSVKVFAKYYLARMVDRFGHPPVMGLHCHSSRGVCITLLTSLKKMTTDIKSCVKMISKCKPAKPGGEPDPAACSAAQEACDTAAIAPIANTGRSVYDVRVAAGNEPQYYKIHPGDPMNFYNTRDVQTRLGVSKAWEPLDQEVLARFTKYGAFDVTFAVNQVLDAGLKVMVVSGDVDFITNGIGALNWMLSLKGKKSYGKKLKAVRPVPISFPDGPLGSVRKLVYSNGARIAFINVTGGSHDVILNHPSGMQQALQDFLAGTLW